MPFESLTGTDEPLARDADVGAVDSYVLVSGRGDDRRSARTAVVDRVGPEQVVLGIGVERGIVVAFDGHVENVGAVTAGIDHAVDDPARKSAPIAG
jgi:hypothetical protein